MEDDPLTKGFNYSTGWGSEPKPMAYHYGMKLARQLGDEAIKKSAEAWSLEMALRNVRLATTGVEKAGAVQTLIKRIGEITNKPEVTTAELVKVEE